MGVQEQISRGLHRGTDERVYALRAARLGVAFVPDPSGEVWLPTEGAAEASRPIGEVIRTGRTAFLRQNGLNHLLIAPQEAVMDRLARVMAHDEIRSRVLVTTPAAIRRLLTEASSALLLDDAITRLAKTKPEYSAKALMSRWQVMALVLVVLALIAAVMQFGWSAIAALNLMIGLLFLALVTLRVLAIGVVLDRTLRPAPVPSVDRQRFPIYSILVPLYDEAHMVPQLLRALAALDWPQDRLDIKLILEAADRSTRLAIEAFRPGSPFEVIIVPEGRPRTKPRALAFALPLARGDFVTVYDAEDRPDQGQLIEAFAAFQQGGDALACVQAPLLIDNADLNGLTALFALEYSILFDGILPTLAAFRMPLPLGGTSNHFRRSALDKVGGWDPYNVTEDADLGIRLARFGYRAATISRPTFEEAPRSSRQWLRQRTRWLKGWMQTWLVHTRNPARLWREVGGRRVVGFTLTSLGSILAAGVHPIYLASALALAIDPSIFWRSSSPIASAMIALSLFNFFAAYAVFGLLSAATLRMRGTKRPAGALWFLPFYWLLQSLACYRAFYQLLTAPHRWEKTPHHVRRRTRPAAVPLRTKAAAE